MNADALLKHFNRISEAPDAIPRIRRFILDLAVRGKLVEQNPSDEPAAELLKRIQVEKARLVKEGLVRKTKAPILLKIDEIPYSLPGSWKWSQFAEIGFISPRNIADNDLPTSFVPMPMISAEYGILNKHEVRSWGEIKSGFTHFAEGDVGLAKITPCFENRKSTIFRQLTGGIGAGTTELHIVRPIFVVAEYMLIFLKCPHFIETGIPKMTGTAGQKRVPTEYFTSSPFPLPPLAEQHRIVAKVDELMALCDQFEAERNKCEAQRDRLVVSSLNRISTTTAEEAKDATRFHLNHLPRLTTRTEHIKQLRQTILNLAVRGRLVPQDPNDEPAAELLKQVELERKELVSSGRVRKEKPLSPISTDKCPFVISDTWKWAKIGNAALFTEYGTSQQSHHTESGVPVLKMGDIQDGKLLLGGQKKVPLTIDDLPTLYLNKYDLLYNRTNSAELVGKTGLYLGNDNEYTFASYLIRVRCSKTSMNPVYFNLAMNAPYFRETQINPQLKQQCGQANVNGTILKNMLVPIPPLAEQHRIVAKVDELMALCDQLEARLTTTEADSRRLLEAVLRDALNPVIKEAA